MPVSEFARDHRFAPERFLGPDDLPFGRRSGPRWVRVAVALLTQLIGLGIALHSDAPIAIAAAGLSCAGSFLLLLGRRAPGPTVAIVGALCAPAIAVVAGPPLAAIPLLMAVIGAVMHGRHGWVWATLAGVALLPGIAWFLVSGNPSGIVRVLIVVVALCLVVAFAEMARSRRERYRALSRDVAVRRHTAEEAERLRIARELHDVLAHSLAQISVQAGVGLHLFDAEPERARQSLETIKTTSRAALDDVRSVLGLLRSDGESAATTPEPDLTHLAELVQTVGAAGLSVTIDNTVESGVAAAVQRAIYRIVQESLTNVIKHSAARTAAVTLRRTDFGYRLTITDPGPNATGPGLTASNGQDAPDPHIGRGVIGMRERAELLGGRLSAHESAEGGFQVSAELPARIGDPS